MKPQTLLCTILISSLTAVPSAVAQEKGGWRAMSTTARGITGDLVFSDEKIVINFASFPLAQIRTLTPAEITAMFHAETSANGSGNLYRVSIPASKVFLHHNTLCGSDETQWIATYVQGHNLQMALFSSGSMPVLTPEALADTTNLCGTFAYVR